MPSQNLLEVDLAGLRLANPVILASGTCGVVDEMADVLDLSRVGALVTKSITPLPREGHPGLRVVPLRVGMLNAVGLANPGLDAFLREHAPRIGRVRCPVIGSIAGFSVDDYIAVAQGFATLDSLAAVELNVSCPNVSTGTEFGADPALLRSLVAAVREALPHHRLFVKLSPIAVGHPSIVEVARAAIEGEGEPGGPNARPGADALTLTNTMPAMAIDVQTRRPVLANGSGGLSGPAIHPIVVKLVHDSWRGVCRDAGTPIIGLGGVMNWRDAAELILAGATGVGMGAMTMANPRSPLKVVRGLERWVRRSLASGLYERVGGLSDHA
ncbi:MAG: dihydroorotate dehydrogenase [Phycisphaeraceae bacterium]|nr:dihydroorotate dehydrogenase [Phycisphaeraceae bacterium]